MITDHKTLRRVCQWAFRTNGRSNFESCAEAWDGVEDMQTYIDRTWTWRNGTTPATATEIQAQETAYLAAIATNQAEGVAEQNIRNTAAQKAMYILIELIDVLLAKDIIAASDFSPATRQVYQGLKAAVDAIK